MQAGREVKRTASGIRSTFARRRAWAIAAGAMVLYALVYLLIAKALVIDPNAHFGRWGSLPNFQIAQLNWRYLTDWFNPAFVLYLTESIAFAPAVPLLAASLLLGALIGANLAVAVETAARAYCGAGRQWWAISALPSFLASFSCCAPTVLLLLGANFAVAIVSIVPFVVPLAVGLLLASLGWSARRLGHVATRSGSVARSAA